MANLKQLIETLEAMPQDVVVAEGFARPHSYRGYYECLAFEPTANVRVSEMLRLAKQANGTTYTGWKGGEFKMGDWTDVYLAIRGECGELLCLKCLTRQVTDASA